VRGDHEEARIGPTDETLSWRDQLTSKLAHCYFGLPGITELLRLATRCHAGARGSQLLREPSNIEQQISGEKRIIITWSNISRRNIRS
jgi:hypothetical protein